jgi:hypothetical protein
MSDSNTARSYTSMDDLVDLSTENNTTSITTALPSSITITPRRSVKAKRSLAWRYFKVLDDTTLDVECLLCSATIPRTSTSTSNLLHHIQTRHDTEYQLVNKAMKSKTIAATPRLSLSSERSTQLTQLAADLIISNFLPLSIVESHELQMIFQEAEPSYILPKRKYFVGNVLNKMYNEIREKVQTELQSATGKCLITFSYLFYSFI